MQVQQYAYSEFMESTALHLATFYRIRSLIPILLEKEGIKRNARGHTPLHLAVANRHHEWIQPLTSYPRGNCNIIAPEEKTALAHACELGDEISVRLLLACKDIGCNIGDINGRSPLSFALE